MLVPCRWYIEGEPACRSSSLVLDRRSINAHRAPPTDLVLKILKSTSDLFYFFSDNVASLYEPCVFMDNLRYVSYFTVENFKMTISEGALDNA